MDADRAFHDWYRFVLSFPPHLVRRYLQEFSATTASTVLDPFSGTGTTVVEATLNRIPSVGLEANPFPLFASKVKVNWTVDPNEVMSAAENIVAQTRLRLRADGIDDSTMGNGKTLVGLRTLPPSADKLLILHSISPLPLHKVLCLRDEVDQHEGSPYFDHLRLALGKALVASIGNLRFGPEVGIGRIKEDIPVLPAWRSEVLKMCKDLASVQGSDYPLPTLHLADARQVDEFVPASSVDIVVTSPPYPNEKDYTRTTRLESVLLGFYDSKSELQSHKKRLLRSNTRGVYRDDNDHTWIVGNERIEGIAAEIEKRRNELGKTSGFERMYARLTLLYFGGMARHLAQLRSVLKPGARLAYVVGDQASYFRVMIRTGELLAGIAADLGYEVERIDLFRTRFASGTSTELREEVVVLRWPG